PFAIIYRLVSRYVQQINLPLSRKTMEMNGDLFAIKEEVDGRRSPRAWVRKRKGEVIFVALYSWHQTKEKTYMNIALPLPWSSMIGILELNQVGNGLELSSKKQRKHSDSGIYLAWNNRLLALPIEETFYIHQVEDGTLRAQHHMWIFSVPFLKINYVIHHKDSEQIHVS
ncbi:MAG TPA: hypothetical protein VEY51_08060, partial [Chondromyces sp.]|nr:hypothetical protein [Chondromyces sp.]